MALADEYSALGHEVSTFSFSNLPDRLSPTAKSAVFPWYVARHVERCTRGAPLDVLDASTGDAYLCRPIKRRIRVLVTRSHGLEHPAHLLLRGRAADGEVRLRKRYHVYRGSYRLAEVAASLRVADLVLLLNAADRDYAVARLRLDPARAEIVSNGLPSALVGLPLARRVPGDAVGIAQVGSYIEGKGIRHSVPALAALMHRYSRLKVGFFGTNCDPERVFADFAEDLWPRLTVVPSYRRPQLPALLAHFDISVLASLFEGFGMALLETMACGLAAVATRTAGPERLLDGGRFGVLVPPNDARALEDAIDDLVRDNARRDELRGAAHAAAQKYAWSAVAASQLKLYEKRGR
jgi:glycosyltransferase involved in cell wall biosynthesis